MYLKKRHIFSVALFVFVKERNDNVRNCKEMGVKQALGAETTCKERDRWYVHLSRVRLIPKGADKLANGCRKEIFQKLLTLTFRHTVE